MTRVICFLVLIVAIDISSPAMADLPEPVHLDNIVCFANGSISLSDHAQVALARMIPYMNTMDVHAIVVVGMGDYLPKRGKALDSRHQKKLNLDIELGTARAKAVSTFLVKRLGVTKEKIEYWGVSAAQRIDQLSDKMVRSNSENCDKNHYRPGATVVEILGRCATSECLSNVSCDSQSCQ